MHRKDFPLAHPVRRIAAMCYDLLLVAGLVMALTLLFVLARGGTAIPPESWWYPATLIGIKFAFFGYCWTHGGQTLGARAWSLRVTALDGGDLNWREAALRYLGAWLLLLPPGLSLFWARWDPDGLWLHDRLSTSKVIGHPR